MTLSLTVPSPRSGLLAEEKESKTECNCIPVSSVQDAKRSSTKIFVGTVTNRERVRIDAVGDGYKEEFVTFKVEDVVKGPLKREVIVRTPSEASECGIELENGERYLVYARGESALFTSKCDRTVLMGSKQALQDLEQ